MTAQCPMVASLAMYPFPALRAATNELWRAIRRNLGWGPDALEWGIVTPQVWHHPDLLIAQTCGWPLVTQLVDSVVVVGTFDYEVDGSAEGTYHSVLVSSHEATLAQLRARPDLTAAVNGFDSLSGWVSLQHTLGAPPRTLETGAHFASIGALIAGDADIAAIDGVSWTLISEHEPDLVAGLHVVGHGPTIPCLPLVAGLRHSVDVPALRTAIRAALAEPSLAATLRTLHIRGFVPCEMADYLPIRALMA